MDDRRNPEDTTDTDGDASEDALEENPDFNDIDDELEQLDQLDDEPE